MPILNSFPVAQAKIFLDFDGSTVAHWENFSNIQTPAYNIDGDSSTNFSDAEVANMKAIWEVVSEDFAPFQINVTTVDPGNYGVNQALHVAIGGNASWYPGGSAIAGVALLNSFSVASTDRTVFCFSANLAHLLTDPLYAKEIGGTISHESGHGFGLQHQSLYVNGQLIDEYHPGADGWGPTMGAAYHMSVETWWNGPTPNGANSLQDDMAIISGAVNGFGYRNDDVGNDAASAAALSVPDSANPFHYVASGNIERLSDIDAYSFSAGTGQVNIQLSPFSSQLGAPNLASVIELRDASGALIATSVGANPNRINSPTIVRNVAAGSYRVYVKSQGAYGRVGQYKLQVDVASTGPRFVSFAPAGTQFLPLGFFDFKFDQPMDTTTFDIASDVLTFTGPGNANLLSQISGFAWLDTKTLRVTFATQSANGDYAMTLGPHIRSIGNLEIDQNQDGVPGTAQDNYSAAFRISIFGGAPDRYEPNDSLNAAFNFGTIRKLFEKNLSIHVSNNDDFFKFTAATSGNYVVTVHFNNTDGDLDLFTYNAQGVSNGYSSTFANTEEITFSAIAGFTYYVKVAGFLGSVNPNYSLRIGGPTAGTDRFELNDTFLRATQFGAVRKRTEPGLSIDRAGDQDYYTFTPVVGGVYNISTSFFNDFGNLDLTLFDGSVNQLAASNGFGDGESLQFNLVAGNTYTIRINGVAGATNDYGLSIAAAGRADIVGRDPSTGVLWAGLSNNLGQFATVAMGAWSTGVSWVDVQSGDFNGDGWNDVAGRISQTGDWYVALSNGSSTFNTTKWATWPAGTNFKDVVAGDFNGDGLTDIAGRLATTQQWFVLLSAVGNRFASSVWSTWSQASDWMDVRVGDFDGDGRSDLVGRSKDNGDWYVGLSNGANGFATGKWSKWTASIAWADVLVGDFNGDGRSDLTGRWAETGQWYTALSNGPSGFSTSLWAVWSGHAGAFRWLDVRAGDFDGDGKTDLTGRDSTTGNWWTGLAGSGVNAGKFLTSYWSTWSFDVIWTDVLVGDFNGDGRADFTGRDKGTGNWWTAQSTGSGFATSYWATWTASIDWADIRTADFGNNG